MMVNAYKNVYSPVLLQHRKLGTHTVFYFNICLQGLRLLLRRTHPPPTRPRRRSQLRHRVQQDRPARGRRDRRRAAERPSVQEPILQLHRLAGMDQSNQRPLPLSQSPNFVRSLDVCQKA